MTLSHDPYRNPALCLLRRRHDADGKDRRLGPPASHGRLLGGLLMAAVATPFLHPAWTPLNLGVSFLTGLLLGVGVCDQLRSYSVLGMSRTMPLSTGGQLVLMSLAGIAILRRVAPRRGRCPTASPPSPSSRWHLVPVALRVGL